MIGPIDITMRQYEDNLAFVTSLTETNNCCWKVKLETGASILITPVAAVSADSTVSFAIFSTLFKDIANMKDKRI